jgi:hypothetical protein
MKETFSDTNMRAGHWETPVTGSENLWFYRQLFTSNNIYFFFNTNFDEGKDSTYVLTIHGGDTFKISDEGESISRMIQLLKNSPPSHIKYPRTYKVWNSPLAIEVCLGLAIPEEEYDKMEKFQYVILAQNETIEFVTFETPKWEIHHDILLDDLVIQYLRKDSLD